MPRTRTPQQIAAGQLILAIQKEWVDQMGEPGAELGEQAMDRAHELLQAATQQRLSQALQGQSIADFLGAEWVATRPQVIAAIKVLKLQLTSATA